LVWQRRKAERARHLGGRLNGLEVDQVLAEDVEEAVLGERLDEDIVHPGS
jgi:hypothetical protein